MSTLSDNNHRRQPEMECCAACYHLRHHFGYPCCGRTSSETVAPTDICDRYEPREREVTR